MVVVTNTSPLSNLAIIGRLELLREQFDRVLVPLAVKQELGRLRHQAAVALLDAAFAGGWLQIIPLQLPVSAEVGAGLHFGETEALSLAIELSADLVLLDDGDARARAAELGLRFLGALGVLLRAKQMGRLASLRTEICRLREEAHFFVAPKLEAELLLSVGEAL